MTTIMWPPEGTSKGWSILWGIFVLFGQCCNILFSERDFVLIYCCFAIPEKKFIVQRKQMYSSERNIKGLKGYRQYLLSQGDANVGTNAVVSIYKAQTGTLLSATSLRDGGGHALRQDELQLEVLLWAELAPWKQQVVSLPEGICSLANTVSP